MVASALGTVLLFYSEVAAALEGNTGLKKLFQGLFFNRGRAWVIFVFYDAYMFSLFVFLAHRVVCFLS